MAATANEAEIIMPEKVMRANPDCPLCKGVGNVYDPPLNKQKEQFHAGEREFVTKRVCTCCRESI